MINSGYIKTFHPQYTIKLMEIALIGFKSVRHQAKDTKATRNEVYGETVDSIMPQTFFYPSSLPLTLSLVPLTAYRFLYPNFLLFNSHCRTTVARVTTATPGKIIAGGNPLPRPQLIISTKAG
jgi:hypothetical protein